MLCRRALAVLAIASQTVCWATGAHAQASGIPCEAFAKNADGSWTVLTTTYIEGPNVKVREDAVLQPGFLIRGYDIAAIIAKACPNATVAPPTSAPASQQQPQQQQQQQQPNSQQPQLQQSQPRQQESRSVLARYADANGNIDVRQLTCGHLDDASADESDLLLAWYSGGYNGAVKGRGINLARLRYNIHKVIDYCRSNRDKRLSDVMELMLK
jgi:hypothetical protein